MKFRYCPQCAGVEMKRLPNGSEECVRCRFVGTAREGAMDEINAYKEQLKRGSVRAPPSEAPSQTGGLEGLRQSGMEQKLKSLKGKRSDDFEIF